MIALTLDAVADGADLGSLSRADAAALLLRLAAAQTRLAVTMADNDQTKTCAPEMLDAPTLAKRLGVTESWIRGAQRSGRIPHIKIGRYRRFDPAAVATVLGAKL
jgi:excisionase family DNA binding protein